MGNNSYVDIAGIGDVCVETNTRYTLALRDVQHVPDMHLNMISIHILDKEGYGTILEMVNGDSPEDNWCLLQGRFVLHFTRHNTSTGEQRCY